MINVSLRYVFSLCFLLLWGALELLVVLWNLFLFVYSVCFVVRSLVG